MSSAKALESSLRENLTLQDWMTVVNYYDDHQLMSQQELVHYFVHHAEGALIFNQSTLSQHLSKKGWDADQHRLKSFLTALSSKRIQMLWYSSTCTTSHPHYSSPLTHRTIPITTDYLSSHMTHMLTHPYFCTPFHLTNPMPCLPKQPQFSL